MAKIKLNDENTLKKYIKIISQPSYELDKIWTSTLKTKVIVHNKINKK